MLTQGTLVEYIREHPAASNGKLAEVFGVPDVNIRTAICKLKKKGVLEDASDTEGRKLKVLKDPPKQSYDFKKSMLMDMCEAYYEDFMNAELFSERVEIGKMICRILEKI